MTAVIDTLGVAARLGRQAGLEPVVRRLRDTFDRPFVGLGRPPLSVEVDGVCVCGFLRHRSALAGLGAHSGYRELFVGSLRRGATVVDGGAHVGLYTLLAARAIGPDGRVLAFEPDPFNLAALRENARRAAARNVSIVPKALGEVRRKATFYSSRGTIGSSLRRREPMDVPVTVEVTTLDDELAGRDLDVLVVRLNIEGAEALALEGMRRTLSRCRDAVILVGAHPDLLEEPGELVPRFRELGYDVSRIDGRLVQPVDRSELGGRCHLLARRPDVAR